MKLEKIKDNLIFNSFLNKLRVNFEIFYLVIRANLTFQTIRLINLTRSSILSLNCQLHKMWHSIDNPPN